MTEKTPLRPSIALAAYAEPIIEGRRVLVSGDATSDLAKHLLSRGASSVHVFDADAARVAEATARNESGNVSFAQLNEGGLALRDGAFDVVIIENLAAVGDVGFVLKSVKRALSARGSALIACANPEVDVALLSTPNAPKISIDYYSLYDAVAEEFEHVRMLGQTPFVGYAIADFAPESEPSPALDTGFVPGGAEEPEWFIALASQQPVRLDEFAVVQLPFRKTWGNGRQAEHEDRLRAARAAERRARQRLATLEAEQKKATRGSRVPPAEAEQLERLKQELKRRDGWIEELEARAAAADSRADQAEGDLEAEREKNLDASLGVTSELKGKVERLGRELALAKRELEAKNAAAAEQEKEIARLRASEAEREEQLEAGDSEAQKELDSLESQLKNRGQEILRLTQDLRKLEQLSRNLLRELAELREGTASPNGEKVSALHEKLDQLARKNASREADLVALHWTVAALEGELEALNRGQSPRSTQ